MPVSTVQRYRAFEPAPEFARENRLEVTGSLPQELRGTLYRNGPARFEHGGFHAGHLFDGDGLVSKFVIDQGEVRFQSRYVRTHKFRREEQGKGDGVRGLFTQASGGPVANAGRYVADSANTHAVWHGDRLLALSDVGRPWDVDPDDLTTRGACDFDGALPKLSRFSPHPKIDPVTGELFNFGINLGVPRPGGRLPAALQCYRVDARGRMSTIARVPLHHAMVVHDFAITERHLVFALTPIVVDPVQAVAAGLGLATFGDAAGYSPELGMKVVLVPRDGGRQRVLECDPFLFVHTNNAYEERGDVVLDVVAHQSFDLLSVDLKKFRDGLPRTGWPARVRITPSGRVITEHLESAPVEFPTHDERRTGHSYRHAYFAAYDPDTETGGIVKLDTATGAQRTHTFDHREEPGEPVFVPRSRRAAEDDGWLLTVTYLREEHRTALIVLDATNIEREPIAVARIEGHFFPGFHGSFTDRVAADRGGR